MREAFRDAVGRPPEDDDDLAAWISDEAMTGEVELPDGYDLDRLKE